MDQNGVQTDFGGAARASFQRMGFTATLMSEIYTQDSALRPKAPSKIPREMIQGIVGVCVNVHRGLRLRLDSYYEGTI